LKIQVAQIKNDLQTLTTIRKIFNKKEKDLDKVKIRYNNQKEE
jgi:hypothetical protein